MAYSRTSFTVKTNGQTLAVSATAPSGSAGVLHLTTAVSSAVTQPYTITSDTTFYVADELAGDYILSCKQPDGTELYGKAIKLRPGRTVVVEPVPSALQAGADAGRSLELATAPSGALAETFSRRFVVTNSAILSSGRLSMVAVALPQGTTVSSITFLSSTTALNTGTNQWFALYNSDRTLIGQTADDTSTAWASSSLKTLSFASPVTTTRSGLHYLGIMVAASTPPSLAAGTPSVLTNTFPPILFGYADTGLTDTAPATAAALAAQGTLPYAYVS